MEYEMSKGDKVISKSGKVYSVKRIVRGKDFESEPMIVLDYNDGLESRPYTFAELEEMGATFGDTECATMTSRGV